MFCPPCTLCFFSVSSRHGCIIIHSELYAVCICVLLNATVFVYLFYCVCSYSPRRIAECVSCAACMREKAMLTYRQNISCYYKVEPNGWLFHWERQSVLSQYRRATDVNIEWSAFFCCCIGSSSTINRETQGTLKLNICLAIDRIVLWKIVQNWIRSKQNRSKFYENWSVEKKI